eukprot:1150751-Pelagomonas_calceolata.AAC.8
MDLCMRRCTWPAGCCTAWAGRDEVTINPSRGSRVHLGKGCQGVPKGSECQADHALKGLLMCLGVLVVLAVVWFNARKREPLIDVWGCSTWQWVLTTCITDFSTYDTPP